MHNITWIWGWDFVCPSVSLSILRSTFVTNAFSSDLKTHKSHIFPMIAPRGVAKNHLQPPKTIFLPQIILKFMILKIQILCTVYAICMLFVCQSYVLVCHTYIICMSLVCTCISRVCHSYVLVFYLYVLVYHSHVSLMYLYVILCHLFVLLCDGMSLTYTCMVPYVTRICS